MKASLSCLMALMCSSSVELLPFLLRLFHSTFMWPAEVQFLSPFLSLTRKYEKPSVKGDILSPQQQFFGNCI